MTQFESDVPPQRPEVSQVGEIYTLKWHDRGILMRVERFDTDTRKNVTAEITVEILNSPSGEDILREVGRVCFLPFAPS